jgi:hypothetical protein
MRLQYLGQAGWVRGAQTENVPGGEQIEPLSNQKDLQD